MFTNVFINKNYYKIEARSMDFPINIAFENGWDYVGVENTKNFIIDADKILIEQLTRWKAILIDLALIEIVQMV
ncbi:MAG: hypothetical protein AB8V06_02040 [Francisella endosymbiont of Hyalomma asiaticum]